MDWSCALAVVVIVRVGVLVARGRVRTGAHRGGSQTWATTTSADAGGDDSAERAYSGGRMPGVQVPELALEAARLHRRVDPLAALVGAQEQRADHRAR